jgi:uncharacterized membrane protein
MAKTVVGLMDTQGEADSVVRDLINTCRCERTDISLVVRGPDSKLREHETGDEKASGVLKGTGTGAVVGGIAGLIVGAVSLAVPGFGAISAAGPIAAALAGVGVGAIAGGLVGGLVNMGVSEEEAHFYAEGVKRGGTLITLHARSDETAECAISLMRRHGAVDIDERSADWRSQGWAGHVTEQEHATLPTPEAERAVGRTPAAERGGRSYLYNRPMEQSAAAAEHERPGVIGQEAKASAGRGRISTTYTATYSGPERRGASNQPYSGAERRKAA